MVRAAVRESYIDSLSLSHLEHDPKCLSHPSTRIDAEFPNEFRLLNRLEKVILRPGPTHNGGSLPVESIARKKTEFSLSPLGVALIRHFLCSQLGHFSDNPFVQMVFGRVRRDMRKNFSFATEPDITALPDSLSDNEIDDGESTAVPSANARVVQIEIRQAAVAPNF